MIEEIQILLNDYIKWVNDKTQLRALENNWVEITTPYLDRHNDYLQIYVKKKGADKYELTDDGYTIRDLSISGCELTTPKRQIFLELTLNGFGVKLINDEITALATKSNFAYQKHNLVQAILAVNDLFYMSVPTVPSLFFEDVQNWFDENEVRYIPKVKFSGISGYDHLFDFVIAKSREFPERFIQTMNKPTRERAESMVFAWLDTRRARIPESVAYAIINDTNSKPVSNVVEALDNYEIKSVLWSEKDDLIGEFIL